MGYWAVDERGKFLDDVASAGGWSDFIDAADGIDAEEFPELTHLADHGWSQKLDALAGEAEELASDEELSSGVADTLKTLADVADRASVSSESMIVTDGVGLEAEVESMAEGPEGPADPEAGEQVAGINKWSRAAARLLRLAEFRGVRLMRDIAKAATLRLLRQDDPSGATSLLSPDEILRLAESIEAAHGTAELLGRARIRQQFNSARKRYPKPEGFAEAEFQDVEPMPPEKALAYFRRLVPDMAVSPEIFPGAERRRAFTMAFKSDEIMLEKVKDKIAGFIADGKGRRQIVADIDELLDAAGVTPNSPQYAEMVFRTNTVDAYQTGAQLEMSDPDVVEEFPVWEYVGIEDGREGDDHRPQFGKFYPSDSLFTDIRGPRVYNCRCIPKPVSRSEWNELHAQGKRTEIRDVAPLAPVSEKPVEPSESEKISKEDAEFIRSIKEIGEVMDYESAVRVGNRLKTRIDTEMKQHERKIAKASKKSAMAMDSWTRASHAVLEAEASGDAEKIAKARMDRKSKIKKVERSMKHESDLRLQIGKKRSEQYLKSMSLIRPMGEQPDSFVRFADNSNDEAIKALRDQTRFLPSSWLKLSAKAGQVAARRQKGGEPGAEYMGRRSYYRPTGGGSGEIILKGMDISPSTSLHEMGHHMERVAGLLPIEREYYDIRTRGEAPSHLGAGYERNEVTRRNKWGESYMGKDYGGNAYEIFTMGIEDIVYGTYGLWERDPDAIRFVLGLLAGVAR